MISNGGQGHLHGEFLNGSVITVSFHEMIQALLMNRHHRYRLVLKQSFMNQANHPSTDVATWAGHSCLVQESPGSGSQRMRLAQAERPWGPWGRQGLDLGRWPGLETQRRELRRHFLGRLGSKRGSQWVDNALVNGVSSYFLRYVLERYLGKMLSVILIYPENVCQT